MILYDTFDCNCLVTQWQLFSTHVHTKNTGNVAKQTIHRTTQQLGRVRAIENTLKNKIKDYVHNILYGHESILQKRRDNALL
jgi:hypothetical protein